MTTDLILVLHPEKSAIVSYKKALREAIGINPDETPEEKAWRVEQEAKYKGLQSLLTSKDGEAYGKQCTASIMDTCQGADCDELEIAGYTFQVIYKTVKEWNTSDKLLKLQEKRAEIAKKLKDLDADITAEQEKAGIASEYKQAAYVKIKD